MAAHADWSSVAHLAYAIEDREQKSFDKVQGSAVLLDALYHWDEELRLGLRTMANGGTQTDMEYYRMGTGPMVSFNLTKTLSADIAIGLFKETAIAEGQRAYTSEGHSLQVGWERIVSLGERLSIGWGGFIGRHWGRIRQRSRTNQPAAAQANWNIGNTMGLHFALHLPL